MAKYKETNKLVEKAKGNYPTRYKGASPDLNMKKQMSKAYKSRYTEFLAPESDIVITQKTSYKSRY